MKTRLSFPFVLLPLDPQFMSAIIAGAQLTNLTITGTEQDESGVTLTANRYLTDSEKAAVKQVFLGAMMQITDV